MMAPPKKCLTHEDFIKFVEDFFDNYVAATGFPLSPEIVRLIKLLKFSNFDSLRVILTEENKYEPIGRPSKDPCCMMRALLISCKLKLRSPEELAEKLEDACYAAVCGFIPKPDVPKGVSLRDIYPAGPRTIPCAQAIRDFCTKHLWDFASTNIESSDVREPHAKPDRPKENGEKAPPIEKDSCESRIAKLSATQFDLSQEAFGTLLKVFYRFGLYESVRHGVLPASIQHIAGDGTPFVVASQETSYRYCPCTEEGRCRCRDRKNRSDCCYMDRMVDGKLPCEEYVGKLRYYPRPDADVGWDSHRKTFYYGFDAYLLTAANLKAANAELPLFFYFGPASRHDSYGFIETFFRFKAYLPEFMPKEMSLDSAHDTVPIYNLLFDEKIGNLIDLNRRGSGSVRLPPKFSLSDQSIPLCPLGKEMKREGTIKKTGATKFVCPCFEKVDGKKTCTCGCAALCPKSKLNSYVSVPAECFKKDDDETDSDPNHAAFGIPITQQCGELGFTMKNGVVYCPQGHQMKPNGTDRKRGLFKFRCPMMSKDESGNPVCTCESPCPGSENNKYGKDILVHQRDDPRFLTIPHRDTDEWTKAYNLRTSSERINKRIKVDYELEHGFTQNTAMCYINMFLICLLLHIEAQMEAEEKRDSLDTHAN